MPRPPSPLVLLLLAVLACAEREAPAVPAVLELDGDTITLAPGARILDIAVGDPGGPGFVPAVEEAVAGDVIRFRAADAGPHALSFDGSASDSAAVAFLESSGQMRALPFLAEGAEWVVSLESAPAGRYVVRCLTHNVHMTVHIRIARTGRGG